MKSAPTTVRPAEESETLAEKYEAQRQWMRDKGIAGSLGETARKPARRATETPRKGIDKRAQADDRQPVENNELSLAVPRESAVKLPKLGRSWDLQTRTKRNKPEVAGIFFLLAALCVALAYVIHLLR